MDRPLVLDASDADSLWMQALKAVTLGEVIAPRDMPTREVTSVILQLRNVRQRLVTSPARRINPVFAVAEVVWVLAAAPDSWIYSFNSRLRDFSDDGVLRGAYGPRIRRWHGVVDQLAETRNRLSDDPSTRRAVIQIYDPSLDRVENSDVACTLGWRFLRRGHGLLMHSSMRSNDVWLGLPYDMFTATVVHEVVAGWLEVVPAAFVQFTDSLHLYDVDLVAANDALADDGLHQEHPPLGPLCVPPDRLDSLLKQLIEDDPVHGCGGWDDISRILRMHRARVEGRRRDAVALADGIEGGIATAIDCWYSSARP